MGKIKPEKLKSDMERWPESWKGFDSDIPVGQEIVKAIEPFVQSLLDQSLSYTTINRHVSNLWLLGGEIISSIGRDSELRKVQGKELLLSFIDEQGGLASKHNTTEEQQKAFDGTCRKLYRYLQSV